MADPKDNITSGDEEDEFDAMLKEAQLLRDEKGSFFDKDDPIEQLLVDDDLEMERKENFEEKLSVQEPIKAVVEETVSTNLENELGIGDTEPEPILDGMAEIGDFAKDMAEPQPQDDSSMDFLMADFDISSDDEFAEDDSANELYTQAEELENKIVSEKAEQEIKSAVVAAVPAVSQAVEKNNPEIEKIISRVEQLSAENQSFKQQLAALSTAGGSSNAVGEDLKNLQKGQRSLKKMIDQNTSKFPLIAYIALGLAILSLLTGGLLNVLGSDSDLDLLTESVATLEEEVETLSTQGNTANNSEIELRLKTLAEQNDRLNNQMAEINGALLNNSSAQGVDELEEINDQAQKTVEQLVGRVEKLEKRKFVSKASNAAKRNAKSVAVVEGNIWFVNLVSFRQQWYAQKKAAEFEKKGVPTEVIPVKVNAEDWFRLRVKGFKSKYDAASYAVKVKKTLNLSSVWVTNN